MRTGDGKRRFEVYVTAGHKEFALPAYRTEQEVAKLRLLPIFQRGTYAIARLVPVELVEPSLSVVFRST